MNGNTNTPGKCIKDAWDRRAEAEGQYSAVSVLISGCPSWDVFLLESYHGKIIKIDLEKIFVPRIIQFSHFASSSLTKRFGDTFCRERSA